MNEDSHRALKQKLETSLPDMLATMEPRYLEEPRGFYHGNALALAKPRSTGDAQKLVAYCRDEKIGLIPYSGGTGLVGGQVNIADRAVILVSMERMRAIRKLDVEDRSVTAEAGVILAELHAAVAEHDLIFPLSLASEGSCRVGGFTSTNAGGLNVVRYGNTRAFTLGIEAVLPNGEVLSDLKTLRKDNTGYDLRHLLIGAEGTLGLITAASFALAEKPAQTTTALLEVASPSAALSVLRGAQNQFGDSVSAFELINREGVRFIEETMPQHVLPPISQAPWHVIVELGAGKGANLQDRFDAALADWSEDGLVQDGFVAQSLTQARTIWSMRETIPEANRLVGAIASHDISVPISDVPRFIDAAAEKIAKFNSDLRINCFGHLGDGNLHYNVYPPKGAKKSDYSEHKSQITRLIHDLVWEFDGSFSAEHGVGRLKIGDLERYGDAGKLSAMRLIKQALDPCNIMNPGAVINTS